MRAQPAPTGGTPFGVDGSEGTKLTATPFAEFDQPWAMTFLPDGKLLGAGTGHTGRITAVHISPDGTRAVTASGDGTARIWKLP